MFSTLVAWLIGKIRCKHDFVVTALPYIDNSYRSMIESVRYYAYCPRCGKQHVRYVYGGRFTEQQIKVMCDHNNPPGKKIP